MKLSAETVEHISSLAAPTEKDQAIWMSLSVEEKFEIVKAHLQEADRDIEQGNVTSFSSVEDMQSYFKSRLKKYEA